MGGFAGIQVFGKVLRIVTQNHATLMQFSRLLNSFINQARKEIEPNAERDRLDSAITAFGAARTDVSRQVRPMAGIGPSV